MAGNFLVLFFFGVSGVIDAGGGGQRVVRLAGQVHLRCQLGVGAACVGGADVDQNLAVQRDRTAVIGGHGDGGGHDAVQCHTEGAHGCVQDRGNNTAVGDAHGVGHPGIGAEPEGQRTGRPVAGFHRGAEAQIELGGIDAVAAGGQYMSESGGELLRSDFFVHKTGSFLKTQTIIALIHIFVQYNDCEQIVNFSIFV